MPAKISNGFLRLLIKNGKRSRLYTFCDVIVGKKGSRGSIPFQKSKYLCSRESAGRVSKSLRPQTGHDGKYKARWVIFPNNTSSVGEGSHQILGGFVNKTKR